MTIENKPAAPRKRFIAGATCMKCGKIDTTQLYEQANMRYAECVACGFHQSIAIDSEPESIQSRKN